MFQKIRKLDYQLTQSITKLQCGFLDKVMVFFTFAGTGGLIWWVTLAVPFLFFRPYRVTGIIIIAALAFNFLIGEILIKRKVARSRPSNAIDEEELKIHRPKDHSFPSGHTASSFCVFTVTLLNCRFYFWVPALVVASIISFSRLYLRVHYLSDVIAGLLLGVFNGVLVTLFFRYLIFV